MLHIECVSCVAAPINDNPVILLTCDKPASVVLSYYKTCADVCTVKAIHHSQCLKSETKYAFRL